MSPLPLENLFEEFVRERRYLKNITPKTEIYYRQGWIAFNRYAPEGELSKTKLNKWVIAMREANVSPVSCNTYISSLNVFLKWLYENEVMPKRLKADKLKVQENGFKTLSDAQLGKIIAYRPKNSAEWRTHTLLSLLIDTGIRIDEGLSALLANVDFEQMLMTIRGKGGKERIVPISLEMRKRLWLYIKRHRDQAPSPYLFPSRFGSKLDYNNFRRDMLKICKTVGLKDVRVHPHGFRHYFAINFLRRGGDLYRLSRILGHTSVQTTQIYLRSMGIELIQEIHAQLSPLSPMSRIRH